MSQVASSHHQLHYRKLENLLIILEAERERGTVTGPGQQFSFNDVTMMFSKSNLINKIFQFCCSVFIIDLAVNFDRFFYLFLM